MSGQLIIRIDFCGDGLCDLYANFEVNGYSGRGHAYFSIESLEKSAEEFSRYPLSSENLPFLRGGFWSRGDASIITQEHLYISARPINSCGEVGLLVRVAEPQDDSSLDNVRYSASAEFRAEYEQMKKFSRDLMSLIRGGVAEVLFIESAA